MKILKLIAVAGLALTLNVVFAATAGTVHAQDTTFDINSYDYYCTVGSVSCNAANVATTPEGTFCLNGEDTCAGLNYAAVQASGDMAGVNYGTPGLVTLACENFTGTGQWNAGYVNVSTSAFYNMWGAPGDDDSWVDTFSHGPWINTTYNPHLYPSTIGGKATLLGNVTEDSDNATSSISLSAYDFYWGNIGTVTGVQYTDDSSGYDTPVSGQFRITIHGTAFDGPNGGYGLVHFYNNGDDWTYYTGTISCVAGGPNATAIGDALYTYDGPGFSPWHTGSYGAEGETEDYPLYEYDHNCAYAPILVHDPFDNTGSFSCDNLGVDD